MKKIFRKIATEKVSESEFLEELACDCLDKVEDYECSSLFNSSSVNITKPSREVYILVNLWSVYNIGLNSGLIGFIRHSDLSIEETLNNLNTIGCNDISAAIHRLQSQIRDFELESIDMIDEEKGEAYLYLGNGGDWSNDNGMICSEEGCFLPKLRSYVIDNHLSLS